MLICDCSISICSVKTFQRSSRWVLMLSFKSLYNLLITGELSIIRMVKSHNVRSHPCFLLKQYLVDANTLSSELDDSYLPVFIKRSELTASFTIMWQLKFTRSIWTGSSILERISAKYMVVVLIYILSFVLFADSFFIS